jgi:hypothetical protein
MSKTTKELAFHPVANLFPLMAPANADVEKDKAEAWADFVKDVKRRTEPLPGLPRGGRAV